MLAVANLDILLELVICLIALNKLPYWLLMRSLEMIDSMSVGVNYIPGPNQSVEGIPEYVDTEWSQNYHTMIVAGVLFRLMLFKIHKKEKFIVHNEYDSLMVMADVKIAGNLMQSLHQYDLAGACLLLLAQKKTNSISTPPIQNIFKSAVEFIKRQRNGSGYGFFYDEMYRSNSVSGKEQFDNKVQQPLNALVVSTLRAI